MAIVAKCLQLTFALEVARFTSRVCQIDCVLS
jgi:hypothetical protein